ncbi:hypothetical protein PIB30_021127 [Stylosanthes scabra]|uniref:Uncharacterized protein n=1 Tax=Stylosanthes scabra TaxID=79078 RepID=A0ABU6Q8N3_9FABA|nr:hypothetical protein [Stylosanthes scabra]
MSLHHPPSCFCISCRLSLKPRQRLTRSEDTCLLLGTPSSLTSLSPQPPKLLTPPSQSPSPSLYGLTLVVALASAVVSAHSAAAGSLSV